MKNIKTEHIIVLSIFLGIVGTLVGYQSSNRRSPMPIDSNLMYTPKVYTGTLIKGSEYGVDYCPEGIYFQTKEQTYLLRENIDGFKLYTNTAQIGKEVKLALEPQPDDAIQCEALICECDAWAVVIDP